jgi:uncharacterized glyoxalase superfamily protein PhnB
MKFRTITPNFLVENVAKTTAFYHKKLGFRIKMALETDTDSIELALSKSKEYSYAVVHRGEINLMFVQESTFREDIWDTELKTSGASVLFYIDVEKVDKIYQEFIDKDIEIVKELTTTWSGRREFYIKDCNGYILAFSEHL